MDQPTLVGGSDEERQALLRLHDEYIDVNSRFDWAKLERPLDTTEAQSHEQSMLAAFHEAFEADQAVAG